MPKSFTLTKRISKHGNQAVIIIPKLLEKELKPGTITEIKIIEGQEPIHLNSHIN